MVASYTPELASAEQVDRVLTRLARVIQRLARTNKRHNPPTTAQRILALKASPKQA